MSLEEVVQLYASGVGCGILLSFIPFAISAVIKMAVDIMGKGEC